MDRIKFLLVPAVAVVALAFSSSEAAAQQGNGNANGGRVVQQLLGGLVNVAVGDVNVQLVDVVDVSNVLNSNRTDILRDAIQNNPVASNNADFLNNLLREAEIINDNQVVVGVLGGVLYVLTLP